MLLEVDDLEVAYGDYQVVWGVSVAVAPGEIVALLGPNGSGKSTVLNTITGLVRAKAGDIRIDGESLVALPAHARAARGVAHVLERRRVFPLLTVEQNLMLGAWHAAARARRPQSLARVLDLFPRLADRRDQLARSLSGGEQQMLALGRGLMARPRVLLLDEPSLGLSPVLIRQIFDAIVRLRGEGLTILLVEQMAAQALALADRAYILERGRITLEGPAATVRENPAVIQAYLGRGRAQPGA
jgi:branched-chain amino acid transport system ATP-binding protein